jgi:hypothetical protein
MGTARYASGEREREEEGEWNGKEGKNTEIPRRGDSQKVWQSKKWDVKQLKKGDSQISEIIKKGR